MLKRIALAAVLGFAPAALLATGCASTQDKPYSLTGSDDQEHKERMRWTDDKGHYRPDLRQQGGTPLHYIR